MIIGFCDVVFSAPPSRCPPCKNGRLVDIVRCEIVATCAAIASGSKKLEPSIVAPMCFRRMMLKPSAKKMKEETNALTVTTCPQRHRG